MLVMHKCFSFQPHRCILLMQTVSFLHVFGDLAVSYLGGHGSGLQMRIITDGLLDGSHRVSSTSSSCFLFTHLTTAVCFPGQRKHRKMFRSSISISAASIRSANLTGSTRGRAGSEASEVPAVQVVSLEERSTVVSDCGGSGTRPVVAGPLQLGPVPATLLLWKVYLCLGESEQHLTFHLPSLPARAAGGAAGGPGPGYESAQDESKSLQ